MPFPDPHQHMRRIAAPLTTVLGVEPSRCRPMELPAPVRCVPAGPGPDGRAPNLIPYTLE